MKGLVIMLLAALLAIAPNYGRAQQPAENSQSPAPKEKAGEAKITEGQQGKEFKFPEGPQGKEFKFPDTPKGEEIKFPENPPVKKAESPMEAAQPKGQEGKEGQAQKLKTYSPKEKQAYLKKTATDLAEIQKKIDALKVKDEYKVQQRKRSNMMIMVDLQKRSLNARKQLAILEKAPDMAWSARKADQDKAMGELQKAYSDAMQIYEEAGPNPQGAQGR